MSRFSAHCRIVLFGSVNVFVGCLLAFAADQPAADLGLPVPRAGESVGLATFTLDGKPFTFHQVVAYESLESGNPKLVLLFSDRPIAVDELRTTLLKNRGDVSDFGDFKTHLKIYCSTQGQPHGCNFWKDNWSVSVSGAPWQSGLAVNSGRVRGKATLEHGDEPAKRKSFDIRVDAQIIKAQLPIATAAPPAVAAGSNQPLAAKSLPMPADATEVEYKELVEQIAYKSRSDVKTLAALVAKGLAEQGWKAMDDDLITSISAILVRKRGDAEMTIFIKPAASGSTVLMMTEGLKW